MKVLIVDDRPLGARKLRDDILSAEPDYLVEMAAPVDTITAADRARQIVREASERFDVFLIDDSMGAGLSGSELMTELRQLSPSSEAIIFTAYADEIGKQRAIEAGARAYVPRPINEKELLWQLRGIQKDRSTRRERDWLQLLALTTKELQQATTVDAVGQAIVEGVWRLGFQRARLRRVCGGEGEQLELIGLSQMGNPGLSNDFTATKRKLAELPYSQAAIAAGTPVLFRDRELGAMPWDEYSTPPRDDWFKVPLFIGDEPVGTLSIDNGAQPIRYAVEEKEQLFQLLDQFGKQAAAALERARLQEQINQQAQEAQIMSAIGRRITTEAAKGDLDDLMDEVRRQVGSLMDVTNFMVVLLDEDSRYLDFRRQYEETNPEGEPEDRHWRAANAGLSGYIITHNEAVLINDTGTFCARHGIASYGRRPQCLLGVPLRVDGGAVGALVVQDYHHEAAYTERHRRLLMRVADQVAGAIHMAYQLERMAELEKQDQALKDLRGAMPRLLQESEDSFWHAVLTTITHRQGNSFNRAVLLWYDETGTQMQGRMGIGHFSRADARRASAQDRDEGQTLQQFFDAPHLARMRVTPLQEEIIGCRLETGAPADPCYRIWIEGARCVTSSTMLRGCLPALLLEPPDQLDEEQEYTCALTPVKADDKVLGLLVVDKAFDGEPLRSRDLDKLDMVLAEAMQVLLKSREMSQAQHLGETYEQILALDHRITAQAADRALTDSLQELCHEARALTGADCMVLYPYHVSRGGYELSLVSHAGLRMPAEFAATTKDKPRQHGVTFMILRSGLLAVPDVARSDLAFGGRRLAEHAFLQREEIKALIGIPMRQAATGESFGVVYLNYRTPQKFSEQDIAFAEHIAAIGAKVISHYREMERQERGLAVAEKSEQQRRREMQLLSNIQVQALAADSDEKKVIRSILQNAAELFSRSSTITLALLIWEAQGEETRQVRRNYRMNGQGHLYYRRSSLDQGIVGEALLRGELYHMQNTLVAPVRLGAKDIGALMVRKLARRATFGDVEQEIAERLTTVAALALDNVRTRANLQTVSETVSAVSDKIDLEDTLSAVVHMARQVAPDIDCVTLWYEDPEKGALVPGPQWGVTNDQHKGANAQTDRLVRAIIDRRKPIFASTVEREPLLWGEFTSDERIISTAAFPLHFGERPRAFGMLILSYRKAHEFTPMERTLFPIFANAAATAIHSAQKIELAERSRNRLETALKVATVTNATLDRDEALRLILETLRHEFNRASDDQTVPYIMLYNERMKVLELPAVAQEFYQPTMPEYQFRALMSLDGKGISCSAARRSQVEQRIVVENVSDVHKELNDYVEVNSKIRSELCAGLWRGGSLLGVLVMQSPQPAAFDQEDEQLFELVAEQVAASLERANQVAEKRVIDYLTGAMAWATDLAHDINVDIGYIRYRAYWLREREPEISAQGKQWAREIDERAGELADKARNDSSERAVVPIRLSDFLEKKIREWQARACPNIKISYDWENAAIPVLIYPEQVWKAVRHLLRNAIDAMNYSGQIWLRSRPIGSDQMELQVENSGLDIPTEVRERLFWEPYSTKGGGMGLLIAKMLLESMKGSISLLPSQPGRGPIFAIHLPQARESQEEHNEVA